MDILATSSTLGMSVDNFFYFGLVGGETRNFGTKIWDAEHDRVISVLGAGQNPPPTLPAHFCVGGHNSAHVFLQRG